MISVEFYIAYILATTALILIPGPNVSLTVANSLARGFGHGIITVCGATCGTAVLLSLGFFGMAWVSTVLSDWLTALRWIGVAYLILLGVKQWFTAPVQGQDTVEGMSSNLAALMRGFLVAVTNPKTVLFYAAFFPQFLDFSKPLGPQLWVLNLTFIFIAFFIDSCYAILAGRLRQWIARAGRARLQNRLAGILLIITGTGMAFMQRN